ncbi:MAG TPA: HEAT repeat domain-containing protein [Candidatus Bilamarchaeum sp.]|nr:HEAT repeat domain-containing protein [Candidatus Bilamarchaeum sp.]
MKTLELYRSLRLPDSDLKWAASRIIVSDFLKGKQVPASALGMAFNIINARAFDTEEEQNVRNISQDLLEKAMEAGIEKIVTIDSVAKDLADRQPLVRILAIENLIIACEYGNDISRAVPALEKALKDKDLSVRRNAAFAFVIMSEHEYDLSDSMNALEEAGQDPDEQVRKYAGKARENSEKADA